MHLRLEGSARGLIEDLDKHLPDVKRQPATDLIQIPPVIRGPHLVGSARGPTGDLDSSTGELDSLTVSSRLFDSFLSRPASLPAGGAVILHENRPSWL